MFTLVKNGEAWPLTLTMVKNECEWSAPMVRSVIDWSAPTPEFRPWGELWCPVFSRDVEPEPQGLPAGNEVTNISMPAWNGLDFDGGRQEPALMHPGTSFQWPTQETMSIGMMFVMPSVKRQRLTLVFNASGIIPPHSTSYNTSVNRKSGNHGNDQASLSSIELP